jgi:PII-like signaling protein
LRSARRWLCKCCGVKTSRERAHSTRWSGGFNGRNQVRTSGLVEAGGNLPVVIVFVGFEEHVGLVLPKPFEMAPHRLIVRENVTIEQGTLD